MLSLEDRNDIAAAIYSDDEALYMPLAKKLWEDYLSLEDAYDMLRSEVDYWRQESNDLQWRVDKLVEID